MASEGHILLLQALLAGGAAGDVDSEVGPASQRSGHSSLGLPTQQDQVCCNMEAQRHLAPEQGGALMPLRCSRDGPGPPIIRRNCRAAVTMTETVWGTSQTSRQHCFAKRVYMSDLSSLWATVSRPLQNIPGLEGGEDS